MKLHYQKYTLARGVEKVKTKTAIVLSAIALVIGGGGGMSLALLGSAHAAPQKSTSINTNNTSVPFVLSEWTTDRTAPSGGYDVEDFGGRTGTLRMGVDTSQQTQPSFYYYEGLQKNINGATAVGADLYVDSSWSTNKVRAGLWGVGQDASGNITAYPVVEYTTDGTAGYQGWRVFNDETGEWTQLPAVSVNENGWNTVHIVYNPATTVFDLYINGQSAGTSVATGSVSLSAVILDNYNYGSEGSNYDVHWSNLTVGQGQTTSDLNACKNGGWETATDLSGNSFKNQGACVSYLASNGKSQH